jgi:SWI/SNF related-matrix-associated actin-dependent regulator of chromatin subfamily C
VFISPALPLIEASRVKDIVVRHQCELLFDAKNATHIITKVTAAIFADSEEYFRSIEQKGDDILVHWWYTPDSYDTWCHAATTSPAEPANAHPPVWVVNHRWAIDMDTFNEYMNEEDYEDQEAAKAFLATATGAKATSVETTGTLTGGSKGSKRKMTDSPDSDRKKVTKVKEPKAPSSPSMSDPPSMMEVTQVDVDQEIKTGNIKENELKPGRGTTMINLPEGDEEDVGVQFG